MNEQQAKPLQAVNAPERFVHKPGPCFAFKGKKHDLRTIDTQTAEALAKDKDCMFLQWREVNKRPQGQRNPIEVEAPAPAQSTEAASNAPAAEANANDAGNGTGKEKKR